VGWGCENTCSRCFFASLQSAVASLSAPPLKLAFSTLEVALVVLFGDGAVLVASVLRFRAMLQKKGKKEMYQTTMTPLDKIK